MFPSLNLFRDIPCPFFSRVACPRPHCHFKHAPSTSSSLPSSTTATTTSTPSTPVINIPPDINETLHKLMTQLSSAAGNNVLNPTPLTPNVAAPTPPVDLSSILQSTLLQSLSSVLASALNGTTSQSKPSNEAPSSISHTVATTSDTSNNGSIPEYRPTPIAELERRKLFQQPTNTRSTVKHEPEDYVEATFSPPSSPSSAPSGTVEQTKLTTSNPPPTPKPSAATAATTDDNHSWVTPPIRRNLSSNSAEKSKASPTTSTTVPKKVLTPPGSTVKPKPVVLKKPTESKVRVADIDLDRVPVTKSISIDEDSSRKAQPLKRPSNGTADVPPQKKAKPSTPQSTARPAVKKTSPVANGASIDDELALFDQAFAKPKPAAPPNRIQQFAARYSSALSSTTSTTTTTTANSRTRAETADDGRRIAHQPKARVPSAKAATQPVSSATFQPLVDANSSSGKIPYKTRQEYLNFFLNELKKTLTNPESSPMAPLLARAQTIEKEIFDKSTNKNSYLNLAAKHLRQLRTAEAAKAEAVPVKKLSTQRLVVSHSAMLSSGQTDNVSFGIKKVKEIDPKTLTDGELYTLLIAYKASEQDLVENGYPAFSLDFPGKVLIKSRNPLYQSSIKLPTTDPTIRHCCRCGKAYRVTPEGQYVNPEKCVHHWGRLIPQRVAGHIEKKYSCCSANSESIGCAVGKCHVNDGDETQLLSGYVQTQPLKKALSKDQSYGIYALDCEMCYTIHGLELVRVSVINHKLERVFETFVKPLDEILDYNTRWSGITEDDIKNCQVRLSDVQQRLLKLFNDKTILIGHSLESDFKALKIVHQTIVDTSIVFPHARGKPFKRALKNLASEYLSKIIQENVEGHDSIEDATTCMELMLWKIKQDLKVTATSSR